jgi:hypothetical protein
MRWGGDGEHQALGLHRIYTSIEQLIHLAFPHLTAIADVPAERSFSNSSGSRLFQPMQFVTPTTERPLPPFVAELRQYHSCSMLDDQALSGWQFKDHMPPSAHEVEFSNCLLAIGEPAEVVENYQSARRDPVEQVLQCLNLGLGRI